ncbi:MAG: sugar ABC transporter permease [Nitrospinota bacterium]|nr:MAG: sugar ABC transporter permease [Nitrospinota bacterium]
MERETGTETEVALPETLAERQAVEEAYYRRWTFLGMGERGRFIACLLLPAVLVMLCFQIIPIIMGFNASLRRWSLWEDEYPFIGLWNYRELFHNTHFWTTVMGNTFLYMFVTVAGGLIAGLAIAVLLNRRFPGMNLVRTIVILPLTVAPVVTAIMVTWMLNSEFGIINVFLKWLGFKPILFLVSRWWSLAVVMLTDIWLQTPFYTVIILAALQTLPPEPHEAARVDGANSWQVFRKVTLPLLRPVMLVCIVIRAIDAFRTFDLVWTITRGEPARMTETFSLFAYREAFEFGNVDMGVAASMVGAVIIMVIGILLYKGMYYLSEL